MKTRLGCLTADSRILDAHDNMVPIYQPFARIEAPARQRVEISAGVGPAPPQKHDDHVLETPIAMHLLRLGWVRNGGAR